MATVTKPIALDESINTTEQTPRNIADVLAEELKGIADNILPPNASQIAYDNTASGLTATNVQDAIDEVISSQSEVIADTMTDLTENKTATVTDGVADFETIDGSLVKSLVVEIEPVQNLNGYSKPWVGGAGKNKASNVQYTDAMSRYSPAIFASYTLKAGKRYVLSWYTQNTGIEIYRQTPTQLGFDSLSAYSFVCDGTRKSMYGTAIADFTKEPGSIIVRMTDASTTGTGLCYDFQIEEVGDTETQPTAYAPYSNICPISGYTEEVISVKDSTDTTQETYTTPFNQTVYGGTLDVLTGELTIDKGFITLNGTENISKSAITDCDIYIFGVNDANFQRPFITSAFEYSSTAVNAIGYAWRGSSEQQIRMGYAPYGTTTVNDFKDWLSQNPLQICYTLATPTTLSLTPQTVKALVGENHISASTGDALECKYSMLINGDDLEMLLS